MRLVGYVRVSTREQLAGHGLAAQEKAIRKYCDQEGHRLVALFRDEGLSGANGLETRQGLTNALVVLESGKADALCVSRLDRLARDLVLQETLIARLPAVLSVTEPDIGSEDATRVLVRQVLGAIGQYEKALIRARMDAGRAVKAAQGGYVGGRPRYGTRAEGKALVPDEREAEAVSVVHRLRADGQSYRQIAVALTEAGYRPRRATTWQPAVVRRMALRDAATAV